MERNGHVALSVVIPAYNEEGAIRDTIDRVLALRAPLLRQGICDLQLIVVDDGSHDRTAAILAEMRGIEVIRHGRNRGYGAALKTGLDHATGDLVGFLDADGTYPPESFPELCAAALDGADIAIGSRMGAGNNGMPPTRRLGNRLFAGLVTVLGDRRVSDCASGMRVFHREILPRLSPLPDGLNFTPIMSLRAVHEGLRLVEVPIRYGARVGQSKLNVVRDGLRYAQSLVWVTLAYNPVRVLGALGLAGVGVSCSVAVGLAVMRVRGVTSLGPWGVAAIFVALVGGVTGVSLFSLGAMFNYLVGLFRKQPVRLGLFGKPIFDPPLEQHFGWLGATMAMCGLAIAGVALGMGISGWDIARLWLYLVGSALFILVGVQLLISWVVMKTLDELSLRDVGREAGSVRRVDGRRGG
ncbi:MAG: putative glycosyltransferase [Deltaproteobacteria bacterium]|nr:putative glycosyltransferase [Deltaproteobacteria bacterium]